MSRSKHAQRVSQLLARAFDEQPIPDGPHILDNQDLMARWSDDRLTDDEREQVVEHLSLCPECRDVLATLLDAGLVTLPMADVFESNQQPLSGDRAAPATLPLPQREPGQPGRRGSIWRQPAAWVLAAAATLLVAVGVVSWPGRDSDLGPRIAMLEQQLLQKDLGGTPAEQTLQSAEALLSRATRAEDLRRLRDVMERAAYQAASGELRAGRPRDALAIVDRALNAGARSGRLRNLQLQVEQGYDRPLLLAMNDRLLQDWQFTLTGPQLVKSMPGLHDELTSSQRRLLRDYRESVEEFPDALELRLNFGRLLLELKRFEEAVEQFEQAVRIDAGSAAAHRALGASYFLLPSRKEEALRQFQTAADLDPGDEATLVNLGIALETLKRTEDAKRIWERLFRETEDEQLRAMVGQRL